MGSRPERKIDIDGGLDQLSRAELRALWTQEFGDKTPASLERDVLALGIAYARTGRAAGARSVFERVLTISPDSSIPLENLGLLALERGDVGAARQYFERAVGVAPRSSRAHAGLGLVALNKGDKDGTIKMMEKVIAADPMSPEAVQAKTVIEQLKK